MLDRDTSAVVHLAEFTDDVSQAAAKTKYMGMIKCMYCGDSRRTRSALIAGPLGGFTVTASCRCGGKRKDNVKRAHIKWILSTPS